MKSQVFWRMDDYSLDEKEENILSGRERVGCIFSAVFFAFLCGGIGPDLLDGPYLNALQKYPRALLVQ